MAFVVEVNVLVWRKRLWITTLPQKKTRRIKSMADNLKIFSQNPEQHRRCPSLCVVGISDLFNPA